MEAFVRVSGCGERIGKVGGQCSDDGFRECFFLLETLMVDQRAASYLNGEVEAWSRLHKSQKCFDTTGTD